LTAHDNDPVRQGHGFVDSNRPKGSPGRATERPSG
jgi:hypothetical protein